MIKAIAATLVLFMFFVFGTFLTVAAFEHSVYAGTLAYLTFIVSALLICFVLFGWVVE